MVSESKYMKRAEKHFIQFIQDKEWVFMVDPKLGHIFMYFQIYKEFGGKMFRSHIIMAVEYDFLDKKVRLNPDILEITAGDIDIRWIRIKKLLIKYFPALKEINKAECINIIRKW